MLRIARNADQNQQCKCDWPGEIARAARFVGQMRNSFAISAPLIRGCGRREQLRARPLRRRSASLSSCVGAEAALDQSQNVLS